MSVLVEAYSVIIQLEAIHKRYLGGWRAFLRQIPNNSMCRDKYLVRVGLMSPIDVRGYCTELMREGLIFEPKLANTDFVVVDQFEGILAPAPWLEVATSVRPDMTVQIAWHADHEPGELRVPWQWSYEGSPSNRSPDDQPHFDKMTYLRREEQCDVYLNPDTGKEMYVVRPTIEGNSEEALYSKVDAIFHEALTLDEQLKTAPRDASFDELADQIYKRLDSVLLPQITWITRREGAGMVFAHFTRGVVLRVLNRMEEAERDYRRAYALNPKVINILLDLVLCLGAQGKHAEALPFAREAVLHHPASHAAWGNLASNLAFVDQYPEAQQALEQALAIKPDDPINIRIAGLIERRAARHQAAADSPILSPPA